MLGSPRDHEASLPTIATTIFHAWHEALSKEPSMSKIPPPSEDRFVLALAYQVLGQVLTSIAGLGTYRAIATDPETGIRVTIHIDQIEGPNVARWEPTTKLQPTNLRDIEQNILDACTSAPQTISALAARAGYGNNPFFRESIYKLIELGLLVRVRGGIRLP